MIKAAHVARFRELIGHRLGLRIEDDALAPLARILGQSSPTARDKTPDAYLDRLANGSCHPDELLWLARQLTVGETFFFRDRAQFDALQAFLVAEAERGQRMFRFLSAGCSSGEEPYSMAIVARECLAHHGTVTTTAVDINERAIARARQADYSPWSLRQTPDDCRRRYFTASDNVFSLRSDFRSLVDFEVENLNDPGASFWRRGPFDIVFCRNVIMYLMPEAARSLVDRIADCLRTDGLLFLGHAEHLRGMSSRFDLRQSHGTFYYQRTDRHSRTRITPAPVERRPPSSAAWLEAIRQAALRVAQLTGAMPVASSSPAPPSPPSPAEKNQPTVDRQLLMNLVEQERFADALSLCDENPNDEHDFDRLFLRAVLLANSGRGRAAEEACRRLLGRDDLDASAHYVMALCRENSGDEDGAIEYDKMAIYLDPQFAMPHLHLGLLYRSRGDHASARRELDLAAVLLESEDASRVLLFGGGFDRQQLTAFCRNEPTGAEK